MKTNLFLFLIIGLTILSCKKDKEENPSPTTPVNTNYSYLSTDIANAGDEFLMKIYNVLPTDTFTVNKVGQNNMWNYSNLPTDLIADTFKFFNTSNHPEGAYYTGANLYMDSPDGMQLFMNKQSDKIDITGIYTSMQGQTIKSNLSNIWTAMKFPLTFNASFQDSGFTSNTTTIPYQGNNYPGKYDITFKINSFCVADGNISTPTGTYKCVCEKRIQINKFVISVDMLGIGQYIQMYQTSDTLYNYIFWTKDKKWKVADIETNANDSLITIKYLL